MCRFVHFNDIKIAQFKCCYIFYSSLLLKVLEYYITRKKATWRPLFPRPCRQLVGLRPSSFLINLRHVRLNRVCPPPHQSCSFSHQSHWNLGGHKWEETWSSERPYGCQKQHLFWCLLQKMSFNPSRFHLSSIFGIRSLEGGQEGFLRWVQDIHMDAQDQFLLWCPLQKMSFNPSRCHLSSISGVGSLEDRNGSRQDYAF